MDIEQLKLILETLGNAGEGAMMFALLWLGKNYLGMLLMFSLLFYIARFVSTFFLNIQFAYVAAREAGVTSSEPSYHDKKYVLDIIQLGKEVEAEEEAKKEEERAKMQAKKDKQKAAHI